MQHRCKKILPCTVNLNKQISSGKLCALTLPVHEHTGTSLSPRRKGGGWCHSPSRRAVLAMAYGRPRMRPRREQRPAGPSLRSYPSHLVDGRHRQLAHSGWPPAGSRLSPADKRATCQHGGPTQAAGESQARSRSFTARGPWVLGLAVCVGASATLSVRPSRPAHLAYPWVQPPSLSPFVPVCCLHEKVLW